MSRMTGSDFRLKRSPSGVVGEFLRRLKPASFERWKKYNENASVLDDQFNENKEKIFNEKLNVLLEELAAAQNGTHEELRAQFNQLEQQCLCELEKIKAIENLKTDCVNIRYEHERRAAQEGLENRNEAELDGDILAIRKV
ncbi:hypothetical protein BX666DRAFT_1880402 [Dichotomocladium elegans]|nr:hypothetical protein BX666DRAFT_1880402 [Dichotomocladium elegans]